MLIDVKVFKKKIKEAWKTSGLEVGIDRNEENMHISGNDWYIVIDLGTVTNKMKAAMIELIGELPKPGTMVTSQKDAEKEMDEDWNPQENLRDVFRPVQWHTTLTMLETVNTGICRVLEREDNSEKIVIRESTREMVNPLSCEDFIGPVSTDGGYWVVYQDGLTIIMISAVSEYNLESVKSTLQLLKKERTECWLNERLQR